MDCHCVPIPFLCPLNLKYNAGLGRQAVNNQLSLRDTSFENIVPYMRIRKLIYTQAAYTVLALILLSWSLLMCGTLLPLVLGGLKYLPTVFYLQCTFGILLQRVTGSEDHDIEAIVKVGDIVKPLSFIQEHDLQPA